MTFIIRSEQADSACRILFRNLAEDVLTEVRSDFDEGTNTIVKFVENEKYGEPGQCARGKTDGHDNLQSRPGGDWIRRFLQNGYHVLIDALGDIHTVEAGKKPVIL